jgi:uncharacterized protein YndB with AHSA1/START domain
MEATYDTIEERPRLRFERQLAQPIDTVWRAITDPAELAHWFPCEVELELRVGGPMTFTFEQDLSQYSDQPPGTHTMQGEVSELDPPKRFAFFWGQDHLTFELEPTDAGAGCALRLTVILDAREKAARDAAGWHLCLDRLGQRLGATVTAAPGGEPTSEWRALYDRYAGAGVPTGAPVPGA